ncbi:WD repeat and FYVE domain-containing protein 3 [Caerostris extrusa]|uniref:WD repeat and FYVE domain-containing protein 3 n=1 Tax=Caerostris extrusa TaxID=172846 RepID=A0AAV4NNK5_CAEEX|nr:WD repeat and FYVE domain-containing protein 3 [Caerostris extrusa]
MCESGLPGELLVHCHIALENENHSLHPPLQYILERLSAQSLEPKDLRFSFMLYIPFDEDAQDILKSSGKNIRPANHRDGGPVPLTRVKTLVSMTTPRDCRLQGTSIMPPFVEFDMSSEGFSCLYLPSIAPQSVSTPAVVGVGIVAMGSDASVIGGIGTDPHSIRLLTLVRNIQGKDEQLICLSIQVSARDKALLISTTETLMDQSTGMDWEPEEHEECCVRVWCPELLQEGQWHHLTIVLNRALHYISQNPGGGAANLTVATSIFGFIGTPPQFRRQSKLLWKQGPCHLVEEVLSPVAIAMLYQLGPCYTGSFQAPTLSGVDVHQPLVTEEKIVFGINAAAVSVMTLAKIRRVYSKADCRSIAKMLGMSSHENATPIHILHNSGWPSEWSCSLSGWNFVGYLGARTFVPHPVSLTIDNVGGTATLWVLLLWQKDVEGLYAAVKALVCVVKSNRAAQQEMDRMKKDTSEHRSNIKVLRDLNMVSRLLHVLKQLHLSSATCRILCRLLCILLQDTNRNVDLRFCETVIKCLGYDWVLLFVQEHLHPTTVVWGLKILAVLLSHQHLLQIFRESSVNGGWLAETDVVLSNRVDLALEEASHVPGFQHLQFLMVFHVEIPEAYFLIIIINFSWPFPAPLPSTVKLTMDSAWSYLFGAPAGQNPNNQIIPRGEICQEACVVVLAMIRAIIHSAIDLDDAVSDYAVTLLHFFSYHCIIIAQIFVGVCMTQEVVSALVCSLFSPNQPPPDQEIVNSPSDEYQPSFLDQQFVFLQSKDSSSYYERDSLTTHSACEYVMDFLRIITVDSFSLPPMPKHSPVIDLLLEAVPLDATHNQQCEFQVTFYL